MYIYASIGNPSNVVEDFVVGEFPADPIEEPNLILVDAVHEDWIQRKRWNADAQTWEDVLPTESTTRNSLEFTHIDDEGTKHWLDEYINDLALNSTSIDTSNFATANHTHSEYALNNHNHDSKYAKSNHTHDYAASSHNHSASHITSGTLPITRGGTGSTSAKKSVTINRGANTGTDSSAFGYDCEYIPYLNMCFVRVYAQPKEAWSADTEYEVATIGSSTYYPANMMALSNYAQKEVSAYINTEGQIVVRPYESVGTSYGIRLAGFWFCE